MWPRLAGSEPGGVGREQSAKGLCAVLEGH